jgi:hypothetical protein
MVTEIPVALPVTLSGINFCIFLNCEPVLIDFFYQSGGLLKNFQNRIKKLPAQNGLILQRKVCHSIHSPSPVKRAGGICWQTDRYYFTL